MELWTCESCGSKNAGEACWSCQASRPAGAGTPSTPAPPSTREAAPAAGSWDPTAVVPHKPAAPSWSEPISAWTPPTSDWQAPPPSEAAPAPPDAAPPPPDPAAYSPAAVPAPPPPTPSPAAYSPPEVSAATPAVPSADPSSWSAPAGGAAVPPPPPPPASPEVRSAAAAKPIPTASILVVGAILVIVLVAMLVIVLTHRGAQALITPASVEGLPQIHGATVDALAQQARQNAGADGNGMLVGVYGRDQVPAFIFVVVQSRGNGLSNFETGFIRGASQVGFSPGAFQHRSQGGVQYDCGSVQVAAGVPLSFCFFDDGTATGAGLVPDEPGTDRALQLTSSGRGAAESG